MAPEQVAGLEVTTSVDVYSLGVVLFEMVTGRLPFTGATLMLVALKRLQEAAPSPRKFAPDLDGRWERTISRCLAREPADRFAAVEEVLDGLRALPRAPTRRHWLAAALFGVAMALVGLAVALGRPRSRVPEVRPTASPPKVAPAIPTVEVAIKTDPPTAALLVDGRPVENPFKRRFSADATQHLILASAPDFRTDERTLSFDTDREVTITLRSAAPKLDRRSVRPVTRRKEREEPRPDHFIRQYPE